MQGLQRRGDSYRVRIRIPPEAREAFGGRSEFLESLDTTDKNEAVRRGGPIIADVHERIAKARRGDPQPGSAPTEPSIESFRPVDKVAADFAIRVWRHREIAGLQTLALNGGLPAPKTLAEFAESGWLPARLAARDYAEIGFDAVLIEALAKGGVTVTPEHPAMRHLREKFREAWLEVMHWKRVFSDDDHKRLDLWPESDPKALEAFASEGETVSPVARPSPVSAKGERLKLIELFDRWVAVEEVPEHEKRRGYVERMARYLGDPFIDEITKAQLDTMIVAFRDWPVTKRAIDDLDFDDVIAMMKRLDGDDYKRIKPMTLWNNWLGPLNRMLRFAVERDLLDRSPLIMPRKPTKTMAERQPFDHEDIAAIFGAPLFQGGSNIKRSNGRRYGMATEPGSEVLKDGAYWLPILAIWHGGRLEEFAGAKADDVKQVDGVWILDLTRRTRLKNDHSAREVVLHPRMIELGFVAHAEAQPEGGYLFPELPHSDLDDKASSRNFTKWWGRWAAANAKVAGEGMDDPLKPFHSFRHTFKRACRDAGITEEMSDLLTGHKGNGSVGRSYGRGASLTRLYQELSKLDYPTFPALS